MLLLTGLFSSLKFLLSEIIYSFVQCNLRCLSENKLPLLNISKGEVSPATSATSPWKSHTMLHPPPRPAGIVYNITGGMDMTLSEVNTISEIVTSMADPTCNIIFGAVVDEKYAGEVNVTIIATGFSQGFEEQLLAKKPATAAAGGASLPSISSVPKPASGGTLPWQRSDRSFLGKTIL